MTLDMAEIGSDVFGEQWDVYPCLYYSSEWADHAYKA